MIMKLTIVTINRNNATGLEKTLQSVVAQTFKDFEWVVIDGASTDGSVEVIKKYESKFAHLKWISEPDSGIYNAKDNDLLFSLPIPPRHILLTRMAGSYFLGLTVTSECYGFYHLSL